MSRPDLVAGSIVRARGALWRITRSTSGLDCLAAELSPVAACDGARPTTLLVPFDRLAPVETTTSARSVHPRTWTRTLAALLATTGSWTTPRAPLHADVEVLAYQLTPVMSVLRGTASRLLLADEVGLGKTIEALLVVSELVARGLASHTLIVVPAGLRNQWQEELSERFAIPAEACDALWLERRVERMPARQNPWSLAGCYLASIDFAKRPEVLAGLAEQTWDLLVVDEAHQATPGTERGELVSRLAVRSAVVVLLSATPHNGNDAQFDALCRVGSVGADSGDLLVVRRTASETARIRSGLPVTGRRLDVRLTAEEAHMHDVLQRYTRAVARERHGHEREAAWLAMNVLCKRAFSSAWSLERSVRRRLSLLSAAPPDGGVEPRLLPLEPDRDDELHDEDPDSALAVPGLSSRARELAHLRRLAEVARRASLHESKVNALGRLVGRTREQVLIFTEFRDTMARVVSDLAKAHAVDVLHGGLSERERHDAVERFTNGHVRVLVATDAAGQGLNLQRLCRWVVNVEVPWNPNRLVQRAGRVARIGQRRPVHALVLVSHQTGESRVWRRLLGRQARIESRLGEGWPISIPRADEDLLDVALGWRRQSSVSRSANQSANQSANRSVGRPIHQMARIPGESPVAGARGGSRKRPPVAAMASADPADELVAGLADARHLQLVAAGRRLESVAAIVGRLDRRRPLVAVLANPHQRRLSRQRDVTALAGVLWVFRGQLRTESGNVVATTLVSVLAPHASPRPAAGLTTRWLREVVETRDRRLDERARCDLERLLAATADEFTSFQAQRNTRTRAVDAAHRQWRLRHLKQPGLFGSTSARAERPSHEADEGPHRPDNNRPTSLLVTSELVLVGILTLPPAPPTP